MHMKPLAHSLKFAVIPPNANVVVVPGTKNAQVPAQTFVVVLMSDVGSSAVVGAALTVKAVVAAFGALTAVTVVPGANAPIPDFTVISVAGVVTDGWLEVDGKYRVVPGVPA